MKLIPATLILVLSLAGGQFIGRALIDEGPGTETNEDLGPDSEEIQRIARARALELIREQFAASASEVSEEEKRQQLEAAVSEVGQDLSEMDQIMGRTEKVVDGLADSLGSDLDPGERVIVTRTAAKLNNKLVLGRTLITATEDSVRREGLRLLEQAAREGEVEAVALIMRAMNDMDTSFAAEALRRATSLASDKKNKEIVQKSGLEERLVAMLPTADGSTQTRILRALTALENPAAVQGWRQIYSKADVRMRDQITAARSLKDLGSTQEYSQLLSRLDADLASTEGRTARTAINNLRSLGGDDAKAALKRALDADPEGSNARSIERALRRMDRPQRQGMDWGRGRGGRGGMSFGGF